MVQRIDDARAQGNETDATGDKNEVSAFVILHRKTVAIRSADGELVAGLELMEGGGAGADLANGEEGLFFIRAWREGGGEFADAEHGNLSELSRAKAFKLRLRRGILKTPVKCLHVRDVIHHPVQHRHFGQVSIFSVGRVHYWCCPTAARRIISTTLGIPISPWHTAAQRPQPTQAMASSRWMK